MPLSAADVQFLNRLLDRHLKNQRSWPRMRYFLVAFGLLLILLACCIANLAVTLFNFDMPLLPAFTNPAVATRPVTTSELQWVMDAARATSRIDAMMTTAAVVQGAAAIMFFWFGLDTILRTLVRWNHHRRDIILITLLREKFAAELSSV